jgi:hypothetical protein
MKCPAKTLGEQCILEEDHGEVHESNSYYWSVLPLVTGRTDQANPFERR